MTEEQLINHAIQIEGASAGDPPDALDVFESCETFYFNGLIDDVSGDVDSTMGHFYRVNRWIVATDTQGFRDLHTFDTEQEAINEFASMDERYSALDTDN